MGHQPYGSPSREIFIYTSYQCLPTEDEAFCPRTEFLLPSHLPPSEEPSEPAATLVAGHTQVAEASGDCPWPPENKLGREAGETPVGDKWAVAKRKNNLLETPQEQVEAPASQKQPVEVWEGPEQ